MIDTTNDYFTGDLQRELVFKFFRIFSRFEYALKRAKYLIGKATAGSNMIKAKPDWNAFSKSVEGCLENTSDLDAKRARDYLLNNEPLIQHFRFDSISDQVHFSFEKTEFADAHPPSDERRILNFVEIVRNNLFHGGKYEGHMANDPARNHLLLHECLGRVDVLRPKSHPHIDLSHYKRIPAVCSANLYMT